MCILEAAAVRSGSRSLNLGPHTWRQSWVAGAAAGRAEGRVQAQTASLSAAMATLLHSRHGAEKASPLHGKL